MDLKEEDILREDVATHWYYKAKAAAVLRTVNGTAVRSVLDVGAGSGFFSRQILAKTSARTGTCVDTNYLAENDLYVGAKPLHMRRNITSSNADLVLMMDVIEHVADDTALIAHYAALSPPGTRFLVTVPAFMWLWSSHDVFLEHYRRYNVGHLREVLSKAGLQVRSAHYFFGGVLPAVVAVRWLNRVRRRPAQSDMRKEHPLVNALLYALCLAETYLMKINRLGGTSIIAVATKP